MSEKVLIFATSFSDELITRPEGAGEPLAQLRSECERRGVELELRTERNPAEPLRPKELEGAVAVIADLELYDEALLSKVGRGAGGSLALIARYGVGYNSVDTEAAARYGVLVTNTPGANTRPTAEWAVATLLSVAGRRIRQHDKASRGEGKSGPSRLDVSGRKLGMIGTGGIGRSVVDLLSGFSMEVIAYDPYPAKEWAEKRGVRYTDIETVCREADFITLHASAGVQLIGRRELELMGPTTALINCARGVLADNRAVWEAVSEGRLWGYGLDEIWEHPDLPLAGLNIVTSPHVGSDTDMGKLNMQKGSARAVLSYLQGERPEHVVNGEW
jgi:D-3-phosphoglycerate dehydrogenase